MSTQDLQIGRLRGKGTPRKPAKPPPKPPVALPLDPPEVAAVQVGLALLAQVLILGRLPAGAAEEARTRLAEAGTPLTPAQVRELLFRVDPEPAVSEVQASKER